MRKFERSRLSSNEPNPIFNEPIAPSNNQTKIKHSPIEKIAGDFRIHVQITRCE